MRGYALQAGLRTHTYPKALFRAANMTAGGASCNPDKAPTERHISFGSASNTLGDPEEVGSSPLCLSPCTRNSAWITDPNEDGDVICHLTVL